MPSRDSSSGNPVKVVLVDDYEIARWGFQHMCEAFPEIVCLQVFERGRDALDYCASHTVDVLMLDILMPGLNGIETAVELQKLTHPPKILILTAHHKLEFLKATIDAGVSGYLLKTVSKEEIQTAILTVHHGGHYFCRKVQSDLVQLVRGSNAINSGQANVSELLTPQEFKILQMVSKGSSNKEIAARLYLSPRTIETHKRNIRRKLSLTSGRKLYAFALKYFGTNT